MTRDTWKQFERNPISHSVAHHIVAIAELRETRGYARVSDVAKMLNITRGSASLTLKTLKQRGLVLEDDNRFLLLSPEGETVADAVRGKKFLLHSFLHNVLGVSEPTAEEDTCKIEHLISNETADRLARFFRLITSNDRRAKAFWAAWGEYTQPCDHNPQGCPACDMDCLISLCEEIESQGGTNRENKKGPKLIAKLKARPRTLADLGVGESGRIGRIEANGPTRQRLLDMGITQGTTVSVQRLAPLGDPIEISLKGYSLAIRKSEAKFIQLEP